MDLEEFVHQSLFQIASAIHKTNQTFKTEGLDAQANPAGGLSRTKGGSSSFMSFPDTQTIEFDVAITVSQSTTDSTTKKGGLQISVVNAGVGKEASNENSNSTVSRLRFKVPLKLPD